LNPLPKKEEAVRNDNLILSDDQLRLRMKLNPMKSKIYSDNDEIILMKNKIGFRIEYLF